MDSAVAAVAPKRDPKKAISMPKLYLEHTLPKPYPDGLVFSQKANSYMHLSDYMATPARLSVPVQFEAMVEPHVQP